MIQAIMRPLAQVIQKLLIKDKAELEVVDIMEMIKNRGYGDAAASRCVAEVSTASYSGKVAGGQANATGYYE